MFLMKFPQSFNVRKRLVRKKITCGPNKTQLWFEFGTQATNLQPLDKEWWIKLSSEIRKEKERNK